MQTGSHGRIGSGQTLSRLIDGKAGSGGGDSSGRTTADKRVVCVGKTALPGVGGSQGLQRGLANQRIRIVKVASLIVTPQLASR